MTDNQKIPAWEFDELDIALARELELDARQSTSALAKKLGLSKSAVHRRLQRLFTEEAIVITTIPDPERLGFQTKVLIGLNVRPGKVDAVVERLRPNRKISVIILAMGRYQIMIYMFFRNQQELVNFLDVDLRGIPDVVSAEKIMLLRQLKSSYHYLHGAATLEEEITPRDLDESELRLIKELESHPRESLTSLGKRLKMSRNTVSKKLNKLADEKFIRVASLIEPLAFGFAVEALIFVKVDPSKLMPVANTLAMEERFSQIIIISGEFDLLVWAVFRTLKEMYYFLRNDLDNIPGIVCYETISLMAVAKQSFAVLTRDGPSNWEADDIAA